MGQRAPTKYSSSLGTARRSQPRASPLRPDNTDRARRCRAAHPRGSAVVGGVVQSAESVSQSVLFYAQLREHVIVPLPVRGAAQGGRGVSGRAGGLSSLVCLILGVVK